MASLHMTGSKKNLSTLTWIYRFIRWIIGTVFIYSGAAKLIEPQHFAVLIDAYGLVPDALLMPVAVILPALEVFAGAGLLVDVRGSLGAVTALLLLFVLILSYGIHMGLDVDCGCFGPDDPEAEAFHGLKLALYRDLVMLAAIGLLYVWRHVGHIRPLKITQLINVKPTHKRRMDDAYG